jgi:hypothetical protein
LKSGGLQFSADEKPMEHDATVSVLLALGEIDVGDVDRGKAETGAHVSRFVWHVSIDLTAAGSRSEISIQNGEYKGPYHE